MSWAKTRAVIIHLIGAISGALPFLGLHPFAIGYLTAVMMETPIRFTLMPFIMFGMIFTAGITDLIRYGFIMLLILFINRLLEFRFSICTKWTVMTVSCVIVITVDLISGNYILMALAESVLICALSVLMSFIPFKINIVKHKGSIKNFRNEPVKEKLCESAEVFSRLSQCFSELPYRKNTFNEIDLERMSNSVYHDFCNKCSKSEECWKEYYRETATTITTLFGQMEAGRTLNANMVKGRLKYRCIKLHSFLNALTDSFDQGRIHLFWYNRLIEHREAVAGQLDEMANMISVVADEVYEQDNADEDFEDDFRYFLKDIHIKLDKLTTSRTKEGKYEIFATVHANGAKYVYTKDIVKVLNRVLNVDMMADKNSRFYISELPYTIMFLEEPKYEVICKTVHAVKQGQSLSGDNYMYIENRAGQAVACISDGMGSGIRASKESEAVVELMEKFIEAGFSKETAVRMINSTMVLTDGEPCCSTIDICSIDCYTGKAEFIKLGAATSYIKREHYVEKTVSDLFPVGVLQNIGYEYTVKELYDGDFIIMMSDGTADAFSDSEAIEKLIAMQEVLNPEEIANNILSAARQAASFEPHDDMTVLVMGIWKR